MPKVPAALKRTYNAVITAEVTARNQLVLLPTTNRPTRRDVAMNVVVFKVFVCIADDDDVLERVHIAEVAVPERAGDDGRAIVRRAAKHLGGVAGNAWWVHDVTKTTTELANVVLKWAGNMPISVPPSAYVGLATVDDPDNLYEVLHDGDDYAA